jgi:glycosyltransferase involved in cell wall biosynthesis
MPTETSHPEQPIVSVVVPTYQHAPYIALCLDGILAQRTSFAVEVLIGEDESTDGTREICQRYAAAHPDRIRLFLRSRKDVMHIMGRPTGRANYLALLKDARGQFIAVCEGDDQWIDPLKLQKQVDVLNADPEATGCFTNAWNDRAGVRTPYLGGDYAAEPQNSELDQRCMMLGQGVPHCTFLYRRDQLDPLPKALWHSAVGDSILYVHLTRNGHFRYLPEFTAVRHMHAGGLHSLTARLHQTMVKEQVWPLLDEMTEGRYHQEIQGMFRRAYATEWEVAARADDRAMLRHLRPHVGTIAEELGWSRARTMINWAKTWRR